MSIPGWAPEKRVVTRPRTGKGHRCVIPRFRTGVAACLAADRVVRSRRRLRCCLGHRAPAGHPDHATDREGVRADPWVPAEDCRELHAVPAGDVPERVPGTNPVPRTRGRCRRRRLGRRNRGLRLDEPRGRGRRDRVGRRAGLGRHDHRRECGGRKDGRGRSRPRGDGLLHRGRGDDRDEDRTAGGKDAGAVGRSVVRPQERVPPSAGACSARRLAGGGRDRAPRPGLQRAHRSLARDEDALRHPSLASARDALLRNASPAIHPALIWQGSTPAMDDINVSPAATIALLVAVTSFWWRACVEPRRSSRDERLSGARSAGSDRPPASSSQRPSPRLGAHELDRPVRHDSRQRPAGHRDPRVRRLPPRPRSRRGQASRSAWSSGVRTTTRARTASCSRSRVSTAISRRGP